jgi:glutathione peroxidase
MRLPRIFPLIIVLLLGLHPCSYSAPAKQQTVYDFSLVGLDGREVPLSTYKSKVLLIVNLASQSIYKSQLPALKDLQKTYADKGLMILGIPSNDFGAEEPGDGVAIKNFYLTSEQVTFPVFAKSSLRGKDEIPLYRFLTDEKNGVPGGDVHWSYTKFIVDRQGSVVARFEAGVDPKDPDFLVTLDKILNGSFKKKGSPGPEKKNAADDDDDPDGM